MRMVYLAEAEQWLGAGEGTLSVSAVGATKWGLLEVVEVAFPEANE